MSVCHQNILVTTSATHLTLWEMPPCPPGSLLLWCHCITLSYLIVLVHQQLGRGWLTLQSLGGWKSCDFDLNCKLMGHHGKSKCRREELKEKIQLYSIFRSFSLDSGFNKTNYLRGYPKFLYNSNLNHLCRSFIYCFFFKAVIWIKPKGIMPIERKVTYCMIPFIWLF